MAKLGDFEFPEVGLTESVELARRIQEELSGEVRRDGLAIILDMSPSGGAYGARIGALRMWGLATGRSVIKLTNDAVRAVSAADPSSETRILAKLARSVPLFNEIHERIGDSAVDQRVLAVMLQEITGAEMDEIMRRTAMIERIFTAIREFYAIDDAEIPTESQRDSTGLERSREGSFDLPELREGWIDFKYDDGNLRLKETIENLDVLIAVLESRKRKFEAD